MPVSRWSISDSPICRAPGSTFRFRSKSSRTSCSRKESGSTGPRFAGSRRSTRATCCCFRTRRAPSWIPVLRCRRCRSPVTWPTPTGERYSRDPRYVAQKAEQYLVKTGIATTAYYGPEAEFYIFNSVRFDQNAHEGYYHIDSEEGIWNSGTNGGAANLGHRPRHKEGYFPVPPVDKLQDLRSKIMLAMIASGIDVEVHHHEVGTAGQTEIDMRFTTLTRMADQLMMYKYIVKNVCHQHGYTATFMPKPMFGDNGSGMHVHMSLWKDAKNLFFDANGYGLISDTARWYIGGLIKHAPAVLAFAAPTTNSYRRLVPGYEAPINLIYSQRNRSAICRIPVYSKSPKAKRVEFRAPDPSSNPYLTFAALL